MTSYQSKNAIHRNWMNQNKLTNWFISCEFDGEFKGSVRQCQNKKLKSNWYEIDSKLQWNIHFKHKSYQQSRIQMFLGIHDTMSCRQYLWLIANLNPIPTADVFPFPCLNRYLKMTMNLLNRLPIACASSA